MPPGFLGLWMADGINFFLEESGNGQILLGKNNLKTRTIEFCLLIWFSWLPPCPSFFVFVSVHRDSLYILLHFSFFLFLGAMPAVTTSSKSSSAWPRPPPSTLLIGRYQNLRLLWIHASGWDGMGSHNFSALRPYLFILPPCTGRRRTGKLDEWELRHIGVGICFWLHHGLSVVCRCCDQKA